MRIKSELTKVYTYDELSDDAKEKVREWWNRCNWDDGVTHERMTDIWTDTLESAGWYDLKDLSYDLYGQGGYPAWSGRLDAWECNGRKWNVTVDNRRNNNDVDVDPVYDSDDDVDVTYEEEKEARDEARDMVERLSGELFWAMRAEDEWLSADEQVREACEANEYEFTENGEIA